jgi:hypothetical protein
LTLDSNALFQSLSQSATWKTKFQQPESWRTIWNKAHWAKRLFGQTYAHSLRNRGVELWIVSLAATRASRSALQESDSASQTPDTSGLSSNESLKQQSQPTASSKTSPYICGTDSMKSQEAFTEWASKLQRACLQRRKLVLPMSGNDSSYLLLTPSAHEAQDWGKATRLASSGAGNGVARRMCSQSSMLRLSEETVGLNPSFAEWMMGWPIGTSDFKSWETV